MPFCPNCGASMPRSTAGGVVSFHCRCGKVVAGTPADARIAGGEGGAGHDGAMLRNLVRNAAHDVTNLKVMRDCPCGLDFMSQIRVGPEERVIHVCTCGHVD